MDWYFVFFYFYLLFSNFFFFCFMRIFQYFNIPLSFEFFSSFHKLSVNFFSVQPGIGVGDLDGSVGCFFHNDFEVLRGGVGSSHSTDDLLHVSNPSAV